MRLCGCAVWDSLVCNRQYDVDATVETTIDAIVGATVEARGAYLNNNQYTYIVFNTYS
jgi:uncharacterized membrane protein